MVGLFSRLSGFLKRFENLRHIEASDERTTLLLDSSLSSFDSQQQVHGQNTDERRATRMVRRIRRIVGQLFSVLFLVRRPTSLSANEKVLNYDFASKLGHDYHEFLGTIQDYMDFWLKQNFKSVADSQQCTLPQFLFNRLKQAADFRR